jgi:hypothetical protein
MKVLTRTLVAALALTFGFGSAALAGDGGCGCGDAVCNSCLSGCNGCGCNLGCDACCDPGWGLFGEAELLFLRYHRADGVRVGDADPGENVEFDFETAPRFTVGVVAPSGIGLRTRYFEFDHFQDANEGGGSGLDLDTFNVDVELFEAFELNPNWAMEVSGGFRYNGFREKLIDVDGADVDARTVGSDNIGGIIGSELRRAVGFGLLYARTRLAVVQGDKELRNSDAIVPIQPLTDSTMSMMELAIGSEANFELANGAVLFARSGYEVQQWHSFSSGFDRVFDEDEWDGAEDVGFGGFTFSAGMSY